jgi:hypothetical protein
VKLRIAGFGLLAVAGFFSFIFVPVRSALLVNAVVEGVTIRRVEDAGFRPIWDLRHHEIDAFRILTITLILISAAFACFFFARENQR